MDKMNDQYYLVYQPIVKCINREEQIVNDYEVLLRSKQTNRFPVDEFNKLISKESTNAVFLEWYIEMLVEKMRTFPNLSLSLNFNLEQLQYQSTLMLLRKLSQFSHRIMIEFTEQMPKGFCHMDITIKYIMDELIKMGYRISIDDVSTGINSVSFLLKHIESINRLKFSIIHFQSLNQETLELFIKSWHSFADDYKKEFVIEGVENTHFSLEMFDSGIVFQQGFLFGEGRCL
ncbi:MAG: EAL domain-containing protein [Streptococcaceae bacterium]|jgi:EAL domain-containing protein (putative c-di-GMP-specific phosphodiesterase class I)|nr:EAL domain-containing protein [Streptococcaceae bacterium]MCH4177488.1 EAL domain-containing protein [Streptococcaceae bacterium]